MATFVDHELLNILRFEVKELKDIVKNSIQSVKDSTTTKILMVLNVVFFMFNCVMYLMSTLETYCIMNSIKTFIVPNGFEPKKIKLVTCKNEKKCNFLVH